MPLELYTKDALPAPRKDKGGPMATDITINNALANALYGVRPLPGSAEAIRNEITRVPVSTTSITSADGSVTTTTFYSDGSTSTETSSGDTIDLSPEAQSLFVA